MFCLDVCVCTMCTPSACPQKPGKDVRSPGTFVKDGYEMSCGDWNQTQILYKNITCR